MNSDTILKEKNSNMNNKKANFIIEKLHEIYIKYRSYDMYSVRFIKKTGSILTFLVKTEKEVVEYRDWYLNTNSESNQPKNIEITYSRVARLVQSDIEEFEYKRVSILNRLMINPTTTFLKQPVDHFVSISKLITLIFFILIFVTGYYYFADYPVIGDGNLETIGHIYTASKSIVKLFMIVIAIFTLIKGITDNILRKSDFTNDYTNIISKRNKTILDQLALLFLAPLTFSIILEPLIFPLIKLAKLKGYLLP